MTALLDITGLTITRGTRRGASHATERPLVDGLDLMIAAGDRLGLIGGSGSGKSLTSLAAIGLLDDQLTASGSIELAGTQVVGATDRSLRPLRGRVAGLVFQEPLTALDPLMRVGAQLAEPLRRHHGLRRDQLRHAVDAALTEVSLTDTARIAGSYPHELSGGQRQRVAIAIALAGRPQLLIADEPTTALDVTVQAEVLSLLDRLVRERGMALLFISHDLAVVSTMVDEVIVLSSGRAVERGPVAQVLTDPQHEDTRRLVASARAIDDALEDPR
ncbi:ABC transporter ATP-binding protein [Plantibacter sp. LMC-P-059a]|uniref:ATP-binding cassette domain-containing protein n=1 Tax=Plantibacter sp. LMC-P-059a TaxID=3040297 RepID=UPI00254CBB28|nr:ABC transporter ATP-binding protein [Plantibacter sp. LMC-P-059a]